MGVAHSNRGPRAEAQRFGNASPGTSPCRIALDPTGKYSIGASAVANLAIADNDAVPVVLVSAVPAPDAVEGGTEAYIELTRTGDPSQP